jgi:hypothetical protein
MPKGNSKAGRYHAPGQEPEGNCLLCGQGTFHHLVSCPVTQFNIAIKHNYKLNKDKLAKELLKAFRAKSS